jgi:hypothetical protein
VSNIGGFEAVNPLPGMGTPTAFNGGLLTQANTNIGHFARDRFSVLPEAGVNVGYQFTERLRGFVGYDFMYLSRVARPGDQITPINSSQIPPNPPGPGPVRVNIKDSDFWAQGVNFGLEFRY